MNRLEQIGMGAMLEREFFELKPGESKSIRLVRDKGARIRVKATGPQEVTLMGNNFLRPQHGRREKPVRRSRLAGGLCLAGRGRRRIVPDRAIAAGQILPRRRRLHPAVGRATLPHRIHRPHVSRPGDDRGSCRR